jgi:DNA mismatch repair protein MSH4
LTARILNLSRTNSLLNNHLSAESTTNGETRRIKLPHTVSSGPVKNEDYGLDLASRFFPPRIVRNAEKISHFLRGVDADKKLGPETQTYKQNRLVMALPDILKQANESSMDDTALVSYLNRLCIEFTTRMDQIGQEDDIDLEANESAVLPDRPDLEKPDPTELETLIPRFEAEELRVMKNNVTRQPLLENAALTINETTSNVGEESVVRSAASELSLPVPINRAGLVREQEAAASMVSSVSFTVGGDGGDGEAMCTSSPSGS